MTSTSRLVRYINLTQGDIILVDGAEYEFLAADYPGEGTMAIWTRDPEGDHHTLYRRVEESAECPIFGI